MFDTVNEFDEETVTKENNLLLTREPPDSILSGNVEYLDEIETLLMIEADVTKNKTSENLKMILCFYLMMWKVLFMINQYRHTCRKINMNKLSVNLRNSVV